MNKFTFSAGCLVIVALVVAAQASAANLRLYTANKQLQQRKISMIRNTDEPGCHNLINRRRVYRAAQIGFASCTLYTEKDCEAGTEIEVRWKNKKSPVTDFSRGAMWFLPGNRGEKMASWKCVEEP